MGYTVYITPTGEDILHMQTKKNGVIIGYGHMGSWHVNHYLKSDVVHLSGIYDIDPAKSALAEANGIHAYPSFEAVLADPAVDFVLIATPNEFHKPLAIAALEAGKHVISEKPVTLSSADLEEMIAAAKRANRCFTVHQNRRWDCDYLMMKQVYESGDMGDVTSIESRYHGSRGIPGDWRGQKEHGGGMIYDWGVHLIDQMVGIVSDRQIERVFCHCNHITNFEVDDGFKLDLFYEGGLTARVEVGTSNFIALPRFYMTGTNGGAIVENWQDKCHVVCCKYWDEKDVKPVITPGGMTRTMAPRDEKTIAEHDIERPTPDVHDFYRNFVRAMDGLEEQYVTHDQMRYDMHIMEAAFESDRLGQPIPFPYRRNFGRYAVPDYRK